VADELGTAVLRINVDLKSFEQDLGKARSLVEKQKPINFRLDVSDAQQQFRKLETSAKTLQSQFQKLLGTPLNLNSKNLEKLGDDALKAGTSINNYTRAVINGEQPLATSLASLQQQGAAFRTLAANVKIGSAEFRNFTQAAAQASQKQLFSGLEEIKSLESLFKLGGSGGQSSFKGTDQLLAFSRSIGDSPAAIQLYIQALQQAASVTSVTDAKFGKLTAEIERQADALERARSAASRYGNIFNAEGQPKALPPGRGPSQFVFTGEETPEERRARERQQRRTGKIQGLQNYASTGGRDPLDGFGRLLTVPNTAAIKAEQQLAKSRLSLVDATNKAIGAESKQASAARRRSGGGPDAGGLISSALIGGAFPLLFGQGGGAAGGGLIGGLLGGAFGGGGGFAGSLVGTLVGQTADKFGELAKALQDPIKNFDALIQGANLSGKGVEELAKVLIDLGRTSEANALIQSDLARTIDSVGVLKVAAANDAFARSVGDIQERIGYLLAGPATQFISWIDQIVRRILNLPGGRATERGALATRGQGTALGIGGVLLGAAGLAAAPFTGGATLGLALGGAGLAAAGGAQIASADFQLQQIADSGAIQKIQADILAIEERRVRVQRDISSAVRAGRKNTEAELRLQDQLLLLDAQREQAKAAFIAAPLDETGASVRALRLQLSAIDLQKRAAIDAEDQRKRALQATTSLESTQNQLALQSVAERIAAARELGSVEQGVLRSTIEQALSIKNGIAEARRREQDIGAQITAARQIGDESTASRLVGQQQVAAQETKLRIIEGATALRDTASELRKSGEKLRNDLESAFLNLQKLRTGSGGLNQFLSPQDRVNQEERTFNQLLPRFREAQEQFKQLRGVSYAPEFTGSRSGVNASILQFIEAVRTEQQAVDTSVDTQKALSDNTAALAKITKDLQSTIAALNGKNWAVNVQVNADGSSQAYGDILAGAVSP
jgi:hypothetical protein